MHENKNLSENKNTEISIKKSEILKLSTFHDQDKKNSTLSIMFKSSVKFYRSAGTVRRSRRSLFSDLSILCMVRYNYVCDF